MIWLEQKYITLLSSRLDHFSEKSQGTFNFRCPICGDSKKNKKKARGWFIHKNGKYHYYCHNCSASISFKNFLKDFDALLYQDFQVESFTEKNFVTPVVIAKPDITKFEKPRYLNDSPLKQLIKVSSLPADHSVKKYIMSRKIPSRVHYKLFYCDNFKSWVNSFIPDKYSTCDKDESRLILPFIDREKQFFGCQGRSLKQDGIRYITIVTDNTKPKIFGLDTVDFNKQVYIFEGPIDSLFIPNSIAMCGSDLTVNFSTDKNKCIVVFDNEPRSPQTVGKFEKYIQLGYKVCFWPERMRGKDVNEMVLNGHCIEEIESTINHNSFGGLDAKLKLQMWRKC